MFLLTMTVDQESPHAGDVSIRVGIPLFSVVQIRRGNREKIGIVIHIFPLKHISRPIIKTISSRRF